MLQLEKDGAMTFDGWKAEKRLRALPFAARCKKCQEAFEVNERSHRAMERRSANLRFIGSLERYSS